MNYPAAEFPSLLPWAVLYLLVALVLLYRTRQFLVRADQQSPTRRLPMLRLLMLAGICLLVLSGCGTAPSPAWTSPPVPAELLTPPSKPVLLRAPSPSTTPGETTKKTRASVPSTEPATRR